MVKAHEPRARRVSKRALDDKADTVKSRKMVDSRSRSRSQADLSDVPIGQKGPMPTSIEPCKPTLVEQAPSGPEWLHEIKFDGYRLLAFRSGAAVRLDTKNGFDWTGRFPGIADVIASLPVASAVIDGEAVVEGASGIPDFGALQSALGGRAGTRAAHEIILYAFDLLYLDGRDLRREPLEARRRVLADLIAAAPGHPNLRLSEHLDGDGRAMWRHACEMGLEGIVSKRRDQSYRSGQSPSWLKTKCVQHGTFTVVGYLPEGTRKRVGALLVATEQDGGLMYAGKVGSGLTTEIATALWRVLEHLRRPTQPCAGQPSPGTRRSARWIEPSIQVEAEYREITTDGKLRHPVFRTVVPEETGF